MKRKSNKDHAAVNNQMSLSSPEQVERTPQFQMVNSGRRDGGNFNLVVSPTTFKKSGLKTNMSAIVESSNQ